MCCRIAYVHNSDLVCFRDSWWENPIPKIKTRHSWNFPAEIKQLVVKILWCVDSNDITLFCNFHWWTEELSDYDQLEVLNTTTKHLRWIFFSIGRLHQGQVSMVVTKSVVMLFACTTQPHFSSFINSLERRSDSSPLLTSSNFTLSAVQAPSMSSRSRTANFPYLVHVATVTHWCHAWYVTW